MRYIASDESNLIYYIKLLDLITISYCIILMPILIIHSHHFIHGFSRNLNQNMWQALQLLISQCALKSHEVCAK